MPEPSAISSPQPLSQANDGNQPDPHPQDRVRVHIADECGKPPTLPGRLLVNDPALDLNGFFVSHAPFYHAATVWEPLFFRDSPLIQPVL